MSIYYLRSSQLLHPPLFIYKLNCIPSLDFVLVAYDIAVTFSVGHKDVSSMQFRQYYRLD